MKEKNDISLQKPYQNSAWLKSKMREDYRNVVVLTKLKKLKKREE